MATTGFARGTAALVLLASLSLAAGAAAQTESSTGEGGTSKLGQDIISCAGIEKDEERLSCYDSVAQPLAGLEQDNAEGETEVLQSFAGEDDWDSQVFEVNQPWRVTWQTKANILTIELHGPEGEMIDVVGNQIGAGGGTSGTLEPGRYSLAARGVGSWQIKVLPAEDLAK